MHHLFSDIGDSARSESLAQPAWPVHPARTPETESNLDFSNTLKRGA